MLFVFAAQVLEKDKEHGPLVAICHVLQEEISLDTTGWTRRYVDTHTPSWNVGKKSVSWSFCGRACLADYTLGVIFPVPVATFICQFLF